MVVARMGVWGKGQQSLAQPQHAVSRSARSAPESDDNLYLADLAGDESGKTRQEESDPSSETHEQDGRHPAGPPVNVSGSHGGARRQGCADLRDLTVAPLPAPRRRAANAVATGGSGGMAKKYETEPSKLQTGRENRGRSRLCI